MSNIINIGSLQVDSIRIGNASADAVYIGTDKVYPYVEPAFDGKFKAIYSGGTTYTAACDGNTTLTSATTKASMYSVNQATKAIIGDCVASIGDYAFLNYAILTDIIIPDSVTSIGANAFQYCSALSSVTLSNSLTSIGNNAFKNCSSLRSIDIPSGVTSISSAAFDSCTSLSSVTIPDSVTSIGENVFGYCSSLSSITIPDSVTSIGRQALSLLYSLSTLKLPSRLTSISNSLCYQSSGLTNVDIPSGVTSIDTYAFFGCSSLQSVTVRAITPPTLGSYTFYNTNNCPIYVPCDSVNTYKSASGWSSYASRIQAIPNSCPQWELVEYDFANPTKIKVDYSLISKYVIDGFAIDKGYMLGVDYFIYYINYVFINEINPDAEDFMDNVVFMIDPYDTSTWAVLDDNTEYEVEDLIGEPIDFITTSTEYPYLYAM